MRELPRVTIGPSIYEFIRSGGGEHLPDEDKVMSSGIRWVPGAMDGALGHHAGGGESGRATEIAGLAAKAAARPSARNLGKLYDALEDDSVLGIVDPLLQELLSLPVDRDDLHAVGRWLATTAVDRGPVKVGIAILGVAGSAEDHDVLRTLGTHEEFSLFVAVALRNSSEDPDAELWALAIASEGWGRIQCVERLRNTEDPAVRDWILREGFRNSIMYEYLAYIAATTGGLLDSLRRADVDRELLTAAGEILEALISGGPAEDLDDYADGADAVEAYLGLMRDRATTLGDFHAVSNIQWFLRSDGDWEARSTRGWTATRREAFEAACTEILGRDEWDGRIAVDLLSDDRAEFWRAQQAAVRRGIDTFELLAAKIRDDPLGGPWYQAWEQADSARAEQLAELARTLLPLAEIATGPADEIGMGPAFLAHMALGWTLQALQKHIGVGADLVVAGLQSPSIQNRNMALKALEAWPRFAWPAEATELLRARATADPAPKTRDFAAEIVAARLERS